MVLYEFIDGNPRARGVDDFLDSRINLLPSFFGSSSSPSFHPRDSISSDGITTVQRKYSLPLTSLVLCFCNFMLKIRYLLLFKFRYLTQKSPIFRYLNSHIVRYLTIRNLIGEQSRCKITQNLKVTRE